jgi:hypothetical protein
VTCETCGRPFELRRREASYCSGRCRSRRFARRRAERLRAALAGSTPRGRRIDGYRRHAALDSGWPRRAPAERRGPVARNGLEAWSEVVARDYEGYVAKDETSLYEGGPTLRWVNETEGLDRRRRSVAAADQRGRLELNCGARGAQTSAGAVSPSAVSACSTRAGEPQCADDCARRLRLPAPRPVEPSLVRSAPRRFRGPPYLNITDGPPTQSMLEMPDSRVRFLPEVRAACARTPATVLSRLVPQHEALAVKLQAIVNRHGELRTSDRNAAGRASCSAARFPGEHRSAVARKTAIAQLQANEKQCRCRPHLHLLFKQVSHVCRARPNLRQDRVASRTLG